MRFNIRLAHLFLPLLACLVASPNAFSQTDTSLSTSLEKTAHSTLLSVGTNKKFSLVELNAELSGEYAAPYLKPQNFTDSENISLSATSTAKLKPTIGVSTLNSLREKTTTYGVTSGFTLPLSESGLKISWNPLFSLKRTGIRIARSSKKVDKKSNPAILQYGTSQSVLMSLDSRFSLNIFYQRYFYNSDIAALNMKLTNSSQVLQRNKSLQSIFQTISVFAKSLIGASLNFQLGDRFELDGKYFRTTYQRDGSQSDVLVPRISLELTDSLDSYLQADLVLSEPTSQTWTLAFPYTWSEAWSTELGAALSQNSQEKSWSLLLALSYGWDDTRLSTDSVKVESQNQ